MDFSTPCWRGRFSPSPHAWPKVMELMCKRNRQDTDQEGKNIHCSIFQALSLKLPPWPLSFSSTGDGGHLLPIRGKDAATGS